MGVRFSLGAHDVGSLPAGRQGFQPASPKRKRGEPRAQGIKKRIQGGGHRSMVGQWFVVP